jgi:cytochrome b subunit of formate dehydrogenase
VGRAPLWAAILCLLTLVLGPLPGRAAEAAAAKPAADPNASCLECHKDNTLTMDKAGKQVSLFVDAAAYAKSVHGTLGCTDCHEGFNGNDIPHKKPMTAANCTSCHEDTGAKHAFHPRLATKPVPAGRDTACAACHGSHAVASVKGAGSPFARTRQAEACGKCHQAARDQFVASAHGRNLATRPELPDCLGCHQKAVVHPTTGKTVVDLKLAQVAMCESCHVGKDEVAGKTLLGKGFVSSFDQSVHGAALHAGKAEAPTCTDCHGSHEMKQAMSVGARVNKLRVSETCARCHQKLAAEFESSVHAAALKKGNLDSPTCTNCHGEHNIRKHTDPAAPVHKRNVAQEVCASCHASLRLTQKYGLRSNTFQTFSDSYHGLAVRGGSVTVVNCASCHNSHAIKSHLDPSSTIFKDNLAATCGQCHPGANTRFTLGKVHVSPKEDRQDSPILYWIANIYILLIVALVGGMFLHNLLDFVKKARRKLLIQKGVITVEPLEHHFYLRMTVHERLQHGTLVISFVLLVVTGFMLRYPDAWWVAGFRNLWAGAFEFRSLIHRVAGVVLLVGGVWHVYYLAFTAPGRRLFLDLLPNWRDVTDPWGVLKYNLGLSPDKPQFGRFCYVEKSEYWALVWGTIIMGVTGFVLWFDNTSMGYLGKLGFDIARTIHFYEAILATLAILVWHIYFVVFNPAVYPMNLSWLTGRMSEEEMHEEHPLELRRLKEHEAHELPGQPKDEKDHPNVGPVA